MILLEHNTTGEGVLVESTEGYDLAEWRVVATNVSGFEGKRWDRTSQAFVQRTLSESEETELALVEDPRWQLLKSATPAQIDAFLTSNVTNLAQARQVLRFLILAVQKLARSRG